MRQLHPNWFFSYSPLPAPEGEMIKAVINPNCTDVLRVLTFFPLRQKCVCCEKLFRFQSKIWSTQWLIDSSLPSRLEARWSEALKRELLCLQSWNRFCVFRESLSPLFNTSSAQKKRLKWRHWLLFYFHIGCPTIFAELSLFLRFKPSLFKPSQICWRWWRNLITRWNRFSCGREIGVWLHIQTAHITKSSLHRRTAEPSFP